MDRPKSDLFKKVELIEKKLEKVEKVEESVNKIMDMLKKNPINTKYIEEEIVIDVKFVDSNIGNKMIIDSGAPLSIVSSSWLDKYVKEAKVDKNDLIYKGCARRFRLGKTLYVSNNEVRFPIILKTDKNDYIKREIEANIIDSDEVTFLCGKKTLKELKTTLDFSEDRLEFKEKGKSVNLKMSEGGHMIAKLEIVGEWKNEDVIYLVKSEKDVSSRNAVTRIHKILNHKKKDQMYFAYRNAGKLDSSTRKVIDEVVDNCDICKKNARSKSKPSVAIPRVADFNSVVAVDLKTMGNNNILWMICSFTKFIKGFVIRDKLPESIIKGLHGSWCMNFGFPSVGFWADNGGEFRNSSVDEFTNKLGLIIKFGPAYSPWSNGINERNHYSCDIIVKKIMDGDSKISLQDAVNMAAWTHNTNMNILGFSPLQLVTGKNVIFPGLSVGNIATELLYDDKLVRKIMERHYELMKEFRESEFSRKLEIASKTRSK